MAEKEDKKLDSRNPEFYCQIPGFGSGENAHETAFSLIRNMLNGILSPVIYTDRKGVILAANRSFARQIAGSPEEAVLGRTLSEVANNTLEKFQERSYEKEQSILRCFEELEKTNRELLRSGEILTFECEGVCADGMKRTFLANKSTFSDERGEILGLVRLYRILLKSEGPKRPLEKLWTLRRDFSMRFRCLSFIRIPKADI